LKALSSRVAIRLRHGRESDEIDESHRHPEEGPIGDIGLRQALAGHPVAQRWAKRAPNPEPRSSAVRAAPGALLGQAQDVGATVGQV